MRRKGFSGFFFALRCGLGESRISRKDRKATQRGFWGFLCVALRALREHNFSQRPPCAAKKTIPFLAAIHALSEIALPQWRSPPASGRRAQRRAGQSPLRRRGIWRGTLCRLFLDISPLSFGIPHCPAMLFEYCLRDAGRGLNIIHLLFFSLLNEGGLRLIFFV